jgi:photosystem II stability/assembly factor-like uncharacterized protein
MARAAVPKSKQNPSRGSSRTSQRRPTNEGPSRGLYLIPALGLAGIAAVLVAVFAFQSEGTTTPSVGLPNTSDYHSLLVAPDDPGSLVLGTHQGLFRSSDAGRTWRHAELVDQDAMNLVQPAAETVWAAGHNVLAKSIDGGATWQDVRPGGLPGLDVHGFAVDPRDPKRLYAAIAGQGLYRSVDGGLRFALVSRDVGPGVMALAVLRDGTVLAGDMQRGALAASKDGGLTWKGLVKATVMGLAVNPANSQEVLASGPGVLRSTDGGATWRQTLELADGAGPIAWAPSAPQTAFVVGFNRTLYRSDDGGATWTAVTGGEER